jgi:hypothetical protein
MLIWAYTLFSLDIISAGSDLCEEFVIEYELEVFAPEVALISSLYRLAGSLA